MSISEDRDEATREQDPQGIDTDPDFDGKAAPSVAKWGMAGLLLVYAGLGTYCVASTLGGAGSPQARPTGPVQPEGVARSVAAALTQPALKGGSSSTESAAAPGAGSSGDAMSAARAYGGKSAQPVAAPTPAVAALSAVSAVAIGPDGASDGDHPDLAPYVIDPSSGMSWVTHWYGTAHFGNLQEGTGLLLDMGKPVTIKQVELALGGSPGFWGANLQISVGDTPDLTFATPVAMATDVGGWVTQDLGHAVTGRYVEIWFTKLPLDSWGTYQEHVYGIAVRGYVPAAHSPSGATATHTTSHVVHLGRGSNDPDSREHDADRHRPGGGYRGTGHFSDGGHHPGGGYRGRGHGGGGPGGGSGPGGGGGPGGSRGGGPDGPGGGHRGG